MREMLQDFCWLGCAFRHHIPRHRTTEIIHSEFDSSNMGSIKTLKIKLKYAKKIKQNRPIPYWGFCVSLICEGAICLAPLLLVSHK